MPCFAKALFLLCLCLAGEKEEEEELDRALRALIVLNCPVQPHLGPLPTASSRGHGAV